LSSSITTLNNQFDLLIDSYIDNEVGIDTGFLNERLSNGLQQNIRQLQRDEMMIAAVIGNEEIKDPRQKPEVIKFTGWIKAIITYMNRNSYNWQKI
jgi:hypothetical protein